MLLSGFSHNFNSVINFMAKNLELTKHDIPNFRIKFHTRMNC